MKRFLLASAVAAFTSIAQAQSLTAVPIGAEWASQQWEFAPSCNVPPRGGYACVRFPNGARIRYVSWQSSVKTGPHEVLLILGMGPTGSALGEPGQQYLLTTHHVGQVSSILVKEQGFPGYITVPAGWRVWVYGNGFATNDGTPQGGAPIEVQITLLVDAGTVWEVVQ